MRKFMKHRGVEIVALIRNRGVEAKLPIVPKVDFQKAIGSASIRINACLKFLAHDFVKIEACHSTIDIFTSGSCQGITLRIASRHRFQHDRP
jgi:hypothetical protein